MTIMAPGCPSLPESIYKKSKGYLMRIKHLEVFEHHITEAKRVSDWVIHICPDCDFEFWDNLETDEIKLINSNPHINHSGNYSGNLACYDGTCK